MTLFISILKLFVSPIILLLISLIIFNSGLPNQIPGAFFVSVAPCGVTAIVLCSAYNVSPENIIKAIFISTLASIGTIFLFIKMSQMLFQPLRQIADKFNTLQMGMVAAERVFKIVDMKENEIKNGNEVIRNIKGQIEIKI